MRNQRTFIWIGVAVVLLGLATWLGAAPGEDDALTTELRFPRDEAEAEAEAEAHEPAPDDEDEAQRGVAPAKPGGLALPGKLPPLGTDRSLPLRRALASPGRGLVMANVAALIDSPLAQRMLRCRGERAYRGLERVKELTGLDLARDVDFVGVPFQDDVLALSGRLSGLKLPADAPSRDYGRAARIVILPSQGEAAGAGKPDHVAIVGGSLLLVGKSVAELEAAVDRAEGRAPSNPGNPANGDLQMRLEKADLEQFLDRGEPGRRSPQIERLASLAQRARFRMNVGDDAAMSVDLDAAGAAQGEELAQVVRGGVALMRQAARRSERRHLEKLLDRAKILDPEDGAVGLDLAVPGPWLLARMGCDPEGRPLNAESAPQGKAPVGSADDGKAAEGTAAEGTAAEGTAAEGTAAEGTAAEGMADRAKTDEGTP